MPLTIPSSIRPAGAGPLASRLDSLLPSLVDARVLLVDDDPGMIQLLGRMLSGYSQLRFATDGAQALALAQAWQPELVLLDAEMPGIDGFEVCRQLKADPLLAEVPVIFVTQHTDARVESAIFELGAADFVAKPVAGPALRARVAMQLRLHRTARRLLRLTQRDALTGLASREQFDEDLELACRHARHAGSPLAMLLVSVEGLDGYRQQHGSGAADDALCLTASLAQELLRPADPLTRYDDEVFALLRPDLPAAGAVALAARLQQTPPPGQGLTLAIGIGLLAAGVGNLAEAARSALAAARATGPSRTYLCATTPDGHGPPFPS